MVWWVYTPHDGQRTVNSAAQEEMAKGGTGGSKNMTDQERTAAANMIWNKEKGTAAGIIVLSWLAKVRKVTLHRNFLGPDICLNRSTSRS